MKHGIVLFFTFICGYFCPQPYVFAQDEYNQVFMKCLSQFEQVGGNDIMFSLPSPSEVEALFKKYKSSFDKKLLNDSDNFHKYSHLAERASLNVGVYAINLGYAHIHKEYDQVQEYSKAIEILLKSMRMENEKYMALKKHFFNPSQITDTQEVLRLTQMNIARMFCSLKEERRQHLTLLMLTGAWVETVYMESKFHDRYKSKEILKHIGSKKNILSQIMLILDIYKSKPGIRELIVNLRELEKAYAAVRVSVKQGESRMVERNGELVVEESTETIVDVSNQNLTRIKYIVEQIRNRIILHYL